MSFFLTAVLVTLTERWGNRNLHHKCGSVEMMLFGDTVVNTIKYEFTGSEGNIVDYGE